ncbi:MAG: transcription termination/antitermination NusG family protein [Sedimentisphaerales bacterium]
MLKPSENPPVVWPEAESLRDFTGIWWVAHTKSRNEKALAHDLIRKEMSYFLPMSWRVRRIRKRTVRSLLPLFSSYLFFCGQESERTELWRTNRVASIIEVKDQEGFVNELLQIEQALQAGAPLAPHKYIKAGQRCRIIGGALADLQGVVVRPPKYKTGRSGGGVKATSTIRMVLQIDMLGQAASVEVDTDMIEKLEETH